MGLLDIFNPQDDASRQSLIALSAGLMQPTRGGFGQAMSNGLMGYANARQMYDQRAREKEQADVQMGLNKAHMSLYQQQAEIAKQKAEQDAQNQKMLQDYLNPQSPGLPNGMSFKDASAAVNAGQLPGQPQQSASRITPELLQALTIAGHPAAPGLLKLHEAQNSFSPLQPGWNVNKLTGQREFTGKYAEGQMPGPNGSMVPQPGAINTMSAIEAARAAATEQGKQSAAYGFQMMDVVNPDGSTSRVFVQNHMGAAPGMREQQLLPAGQGRPMPQGNNPQPKVRTDPNFPRANGSWNDDRLPILQAELQAARARGDAKAIGYLEKEIAAIPASNAALSGAQPGQVQPQVAGPVVKPSPMVEKRGSAVLDADKKRLDEANTVASNMQTTLNSLDAIERQIRSSGSGGNDKGGVYQNGLSDRFATFAERSGFNNTFGRSDPKAVRTQALYQSGEQLVVGSGLGGQVSDSDRKAYEKARGQLNTAQTDAQRYEAINTMREIASRAMQNANQLRASIESGQGAPAYQAPTKNTGWQQHYQSEAAAVQDAKNAIMRAPTKRREIIQRLEELGVTNHGMSK